MAGALKPITILHGDGREEVVPPAVCQAFAAFARGDATPNQQRECLTWVFRLTQPFGFAPAAATDRAAAMAEGARIVGLQISRLVGGEEPWSLKHLGDVDDRSGD